MAKPYDVVIVGGGPAGIFTALELVQSSELRVLILEKGQALDFRRCPSISNHRGCLSCSPCNMVSGWGGSGAFSDGKLTLSPEVGGHLASYQGFENAEKLIHYVDEAYLKFGAPRNLFGAGPAVADLKRRASEAGLNLIPVPIRHLGTEHCHEILRRMQDFLAHRVEVRTNSVVDAVILRNGRLAGVRTQDGQNIEATYLVIAPGREGSDWLVREAARLGLTKHNNPVDVGVRVEVPAAVLADLTDALYECKLEFFSRTFKDRIRTFCMCPAGEVTMESTGGADPVISVNGHSYADRKSPNTNFALLGSATFAEPFNDPITYGRSIARLANVLSGGIILQRLGDLRKGNPSSAAGLGRWKVQPSLRSAVPGDISAVLPYRFLKGINEMLSAMDKLAPGVASPHTLLYGIEVKFYSSRLQLTENLETEVPNLFAIGDGAGVSRGLVQASASGVIAAREILHRAGRAQITKFQDTIAKK